MGLDLPLSYIVELDWLGITWVDARSYEGETRELLPDVRNWLNHLACYTYNYGSNDSYMTVVFRFAYIRDARHFKLVWGKR